MLLEHVCHTMVNCFTLCTQPKVLRADSARDALSVDMRLPFNGLLFSFHMTGNECTGTRR
jgi:hypothetical protein